MLSSIVAEDHHLVSTKRFVLIMKIPPTSNLEIGGLAALSRGGCYGYLSRAVHHDIICLGEQQQSPRMSPCAPWVCCGIFCSLTGADSEGPHFFNLACFFF